jgi:hypothetical protein
MQSKLELLRSEGRKALASREFYPYYDQTTYSTETLFEKFKASKNQHRFLKLVWAFGVDWPCNKIELAKICPDVCPIFGTPLDYGRGFNRVLNPSINNDEGFYQPSIDHIIPRAQGGKDELSNYIVVSRKANQYKSDMSSLEELTHFFEGVRKTYYGQS